MLTILNLGLDNKEFLCITLTVEPTWTYVPKQLMIIHL